MISGSESDDSKCLLRSPSASSERRKKRLLDDSDDDEPLVKDADVKEADVKDADSEDDEPLIKEVDIADLGEDDIIMKKKRKPASERPKNAAGGPTRIERLIEQTLAEDDEAPIWNATGEAVANLISGTDVQLVATGGSKKKKHKNAADSSKLSRREKKLKKKAKKKAKKEKESKKRPSKKWRFRELDSDESSDEDALAPQHVDDLVRGAELAMQKAGEDVPNDSVTEKAQTALRELMTKYADEEITEADKKRPAKPKGPRPPKMLGESSREIVPLKKAPPRTVGKPEDTKTSDTWSTWKDSKSWDNNDWKKDDNKWSKDNDWSNDWKKEDSKDDWKEKKDWKNWDDNKNGWNNDKKDSWGNNDKKDSWSNSDTKKKFTIRMNDAARQEYLRKHPADVSFFSYNSGRTRIDQEWQKTVVAQFAQMADVR